MHIPDAAISPVTSLSTGAAMLPVWATAARHLRASLGTRRTPLLAIGAAFCFTIMMFNIPVPGGTTVHPVGGVLLAVLLGPWAAVLGVTVALVIQALFFADGGVLAIGVNSFTMALAMPFAGYLVYRLTAAGCAADSPRRAVAAGAGAYVGVNAAALLTAICLGVQPALFHDSSGRALYFPFPLGVTVPALLAAHLVVAGPAEAIVTGLAVRYLQRAGIALHDGAAGVGPRGRWELVWIAVLALAAMSPLGLLARGDAWGEWSADEVARRAGYVPARLGAMNAHGWHGFSLLPDYLSDRGPLFYALAALAGITLVAVAAWLASRLIAGRREPAPSSAQATALQLGQLPTWLSEGESAQPQASGAGRGSGRFVEKTLAGIAESVRDALFDEKWARRPGLLQRVNPNVKVLGLLSCVVAATFLRRWEALAGLYALATALAALSGLPAAALPKRVWLSAPLFAGAIVLPSALNIVTPGRALVVLSHAPYLALTLPGVAAAGLFTLRIGVALSFVMLLALTTTWADLLHGLRGLMVPRPFVAVFAMAYRYLAVLMQSASDMFVARRSRTVGRVADSANRGFLGGALGSLFGKTLAMTDEVHAAMLSRGWTGEARTLRRPGIRTSDLLWLAAVLSCAAAAFLLERVSG